MSEKQTPQVIDKSKSRKNAREPKEASWELHTQEVTGSSPVAPTITINSLQAAKQRESSVKRANLGRQLAGVKPTVWAAEPRMSKDLGHLFNLRRQQSRYGAPEQAMAVFPRMDGLRDMQATLEALPLHREEARMLDPRLLQSARWRPFPLPCPIARRARHGAAVHASQLLPPNELRASTANFRRTSRSGRLLFSSSQVPCRQRLVFRRLSATPNVRA